MKPELSINTRTQLLDFVLKPVRRLDPEEAIDLDKILKESKCYAFSDEGYLYTIVTNLTYSPPFYYVTLCKMKPVGKPP